VSAAAHLDSAQKVALGHGLEIILRLKPKGGTAVAPMGVFPAARQETDMTVGQGLKAISCGLLAAATAAAPARAADPYHGEQLARRWCTSCHVVASDQRGVTGEAPPFATIARQPNFDKERLAFFLLDPHPKMPDMSLTRFEAGDIAAYIATLR
jgi:mono/diheme cytochrome c family protein